jgi:tetratricopeptide (TPR) repeat protein
MTDPLRSDHLTEAGEVPDRDRDARVESLLLAGLDHYFFGQHERAISVWTRVLFLDRGHARARAYIDRARGAIAERQREGDELLHTGAAAVDRGDARAARRLLDSAVERGAPSEDALVLLEKLNRLEHANAGSASAARTAPSIEALDQRPSPAADRASSSRAAWVTTGVLVGLAAAGVAAWIALHRPGWLPVGSTAIAPQAVEAAEPLPVPAAAEISLARARRLYDEGRLRDALSALQRIGQGDPLKAEADELKAAIQSTLLETVRGRPSVSGVGGAGETGARPRAAAPRTGSPPAASRK